MTNEMKLLLALCDALDFKVKEVHATHKGSVVWGEFDYKITKNKETESEEVIALKDMIERLNKYNRELYISNYELKADLERWRKN